mmetsp:Transcript_7793/g.18092  ORF Transcript_7793/g.18092 Transcript_7793/m.18092 type:complete len:282 (+) Transcript_7793:1587-2432(+)
MASDCASDAGVFCTEDGTRSRDLLGVVVAIGGGCAAVWLESICVSCASCSICCGVKPPPWAAPALAAPNGDWAPNGLPAPDAKGEAPGVAKAPAPKADCDCCWPKGLEPNAPKVPAAPNGDEEGADPAAKGEPDVAPKAVEPKGLGVWPKVPKGDAVPPNAGADEEAPNALDDAAPNAVAPKGEDAAPNGELAAPNGELVAPKGELVAPKGVEVAPKGELVAAPNGDAAPVAAPKGDEVAPNGEEAGRAPKAVLPPNAEELPPNGLEAAAPKAPKLLEEAA